MSRSLHPFCPVLLLNRDENYLFDSPAKDHFVAPTRSSHIDDINTGHCYRKTYETLVKTKDVDMILPAKMAMDKTQIHSDRRIQYQMPGTCHMSPAVEKGARHIRLHARSN